MNLFNKIFCRHKWKVHAKTKFTKLWAYDAIPEIPYEFTKEVLICECCGKIKKIEY